ncbi:uncharacterized protein METZ01_LOCUS5321 [marine metagenome]|jgi:hypothetical protein|uniref:Uncharacterized protein n=1 Tax=marine metagenome TaxID=408172 RepID=A0A381ND62_9ZZZZ|tara:strand:- start:193 stop:384 length:192 start_codon:yes stop_codon:yes gene_type:complete
MKNQGVYENVNPYENSTLSKKYQATKFPSGIHCNNILDKIGFINIENRPQTFGASTIYVAKKK